MTKRKQIKLNFNNLLYAQLRNQFENQLYAQFRNQLRFQLDDQLSAPVWNHSRYRMWNHDKT
jgi:hypothetical protein